MRVGLYSMVRANRSSKLGKLGGPLMKSAITFDFSPSTPGVTSTSTTERTNSGATAVSAIGGEPAERHADHTACIRRQLSDRDRDVGRERLRRDLTAGGLVRTVGVTVPGQVDRDQRPVDRHRHRVPGVRVLRAAVEEHVLGIFGAPHQRADLAAVGKLRRTRVGRSVGRRRATRTLPRSRGTDRTRRTRHAPCHPSPITTASASGSYATGDASTGARLPADDARAAAPRRRAARRRRLRRQRGAALQLP